jgi:hypothetical protein
MIIRLLTLVALLTAEASGAASLAPPAPLRGVPLTGTTGLRLLVANNPPFLVDVDTGRITKVGGLNVRDKPVLSVRAVGRDAIVWLDRHATNVPAAEIYVVRRGATRATRLATGWEVAPAADGRAVWIKSYTRQRRCVLREVRLDRRPRRSPRPVPCSTRLVDAGTGALLVQGRSVLDPRTGRTLLRTGGVWAMSGQFALTSAGSRRPLALTDLGSGARWGLPWPSEINGRDEAAVQPNAGLIALAFSDPAYEGSGTQVTDVWLLDPTTRSFQHLPDMPAAVSLKSTSMCWTSDGRLVLLAETARRNVVAIWRPGRERIELRRVGLPVRNSGSDSFVVW